MTYFASYNKCPCMILYTQMLK